MKWRQLQQTRQVERAQNREETVESELDVTWIVEGDGKGESDSSVSS